MRAKDLTRATSTPIGRRMLWLRVSGLAIAGGVLLLIVSLPEFANEEQNTGPGVGWFVIAGVVVLGVMSATYILMRRSAFSRPHAFLVAAAMLPASYITAVALLLLIITLAS